MREGKTKSTGPDVLSLGAGCLWGCFDPVLGQSGRASVGSIPARFPVLGTAPPPSRRVLRESARPGVGLAARRGRPAPTPARLCGLGEPGRFPRRGGRNKVGGGGWRRIRSPRSSSRRMAASPRARRVRFGRSAPWSFERRPESLRRIVLLGVCVFCPSLGAAGQIDRRGRVAYIGRCGPPGRAKWGGSAKNGGRGPRRRR